MKGSFIFTSALIGLSMSSVFANDIIALSQETSYDNNSSKPRIAVKNEGTTDFSNFQVYYYLDAAEGKTPVVQDWYSPYSTVSLEHVTNTMYRVRLDYSGYTLAAGATLPNPDGVSLGLHFNDWSDWDKSDDPSYLDAHSMTLNDNIVITDSRGVVVFGQIPSSTGSETPPSTDTDVPVEIGGGLKIFAMDEGLAEGNFSKPRFRIQNVGTSSISDFKVAYYFKTENGKTPILEDWYTPNSSVAIEFVQDDLYRLVYDFSGFTLEAGASTPWPEASNIVGLHYGDWSAWDKSNDYSSPATSNLMETSHILLFDSQDHLIYGLLPPELVPTRNPISGDVRRLFSFNNPQPYDLTSYTQQGIIIDFLTYQGAQVMKVETLPDHDTPPCFKFNTLDVGYPTPIGSQMTLRAALPSGFIEVGQFGGDGVGRLLFYVHGGERHTDLRDYTFTISEEQRAAWNTGLDEEMRLCIWTASYGNHYTAYVDELILEGSY